MTNNRTVPTRGETNPEIMPALDPSDEDEFAEVQHREGLAMTLDQSLALLGIYLDHEEHCAWCGIDIDGQNSDLTWDAEELCMDCFAVWCKDHGMTDEGDPLEEED